MTTAVAGKNEEKLSINLLITVNKTNCMVKLLSLWSTLYKSNNSQHQICIFELLSSSLSQACPIIWVHVS